MLFKKTCTYLIFQVTTIDIVINYCKINVVTVQLLKHSHLF